MLGADCSKVLFTGDFTSTEPKPAGLWLRKAFVEGSVVAVCIDEIIGLPVASLKVLEALFNEFVLCWLLVEAGRNAGAGFLKIAESVASGFLSSKGPNLGVLSIFLADIEGETSGEGKGIFSAKELPWGYWNSVVTEFALDASTLNGAIVED